MTPDTAASTIRLYNSMTRKKETLVPLRDGQISLYACGVTTYDECHLGHALQAIVFDMISRYLRHRGFQVDYVRNYTDVDDKIIARAAERGMTPLALSSSMIERERADMASIGIAPPTRSPKVSEFIPQIVAFIERLIEKDAAYATDKGNVYYRVRSKEDYGKLSGRNVDELRAGTRKELEEDKEDAVDFALWKAEDVKGAAWESPWGPGRPGWHIECSVMGYELLGPRFDIHGGGLDLIFPHHENEVAQSESYVGARHVNYWVHNGLLTVNKEKMSKSLGNFFTIRDGVKRFGAELIRFTMLQYHYRSNADFSPQAMAICAVRLAAVYEHAQKLEDAAAKAGIAGEGFDACIRALPSPLALAASRRAEEIEEGFTAAMDDDFNAPSGLVALLDGTKAIDELLKQKKTPDADRARAARVVWERMRKLGAIFGIFQLVPSDYFADLKRRFLEAGRAGATAEWIESEMEKRKDARARKDFATSDAIRDELAAKGVELRDRPAGTDWMVTKEALEAIFA